MANGEEQPAVVLKPVKAADEGEVEREAEEGLELVPGVPRIRAF